MKPLTTIKMLVWSIALMATAATLAGICTSDGSGAFVHTSIRGEQVIIYGKGIYRHMSADVAPQGIAQDVVTLLIGVPLLLFSLYLAGKGGLRGRFLLAGTLAYFLITYLFYMLMGMYNELFLLYVMLCSASFFGFLYALNFIPKSELQNALGHSFSVKLTGSFMVFNAVAIGLLWLMVVVPPLVEGAFPAELAHYTTLIVQGLDLSILLPACFMLGIYLLKKKPLGYWLGPVYIIFLAILMTSLTAKVIGMAMMGVEVFPASILIPAFAIMAIACASYILVSMKRIKLS